MNIFADGVRNLVFDEKTKEFAEATGKQSLKFTIKCMNYWEIQPFLGATENPSERMRSALALCLLSIGGSESEAKKFIDNPNVFMVAPLYQAIIEFSAGN